MPLVISFIQNIIFLRHLYGRCGQDRLIGSSLAIRHSELLVGFVEGRVQNAQQKSLFLVICWVGLLVRGKPLGL